MKNILSNVIKNELELREKHYKHGIDNHILCKLIEHLFYNDKSSYNKIIKRLFKNSKREYNETFLEENEIHVVSNNHCYSIIESLNM